MKRRDALKYCGVAALAVTVPMTLGKAKSFTVPFSEKYYPDLTSEMVEEHVKDLYDNLPVYYKYSMSHDGKTPNGHVWMRHHPTFDGPHPPLSKSKVKVVNGERIRVFESETVLTWKK